MKHTKTTDVFVVGGGPAGLAAAIAARMQGFEVTAADGAAPPIEKTCGEGLMPETVAALRELGVAFRAGDGEPFRGIRFLQPGARVSGEFPSGGGPGLGLRRIVLHQRLVERAEECGVKMLWRTPVAGIEDGCVRFADERVTAQWIVGADGAGSRVRRWSGIEARNYRQRFAARRHYRLRPWSNYVEVHWGESSQAYVTPVSAHEVSVVMLAARQEDTRFDGVDGALGKFPEIRERIESAELASRERGAVTAMCRLRNVQRGNVALVGDASGGVDAITGEGIQLGLQHAMALASAMKAGDLMQYERAHRKFAIRPYRMGQLLLWLDGNPELRRRVVRALAGQPELFARGLAMHVGSSDASSVISTGAHLGWRLLVS